MQKYCLLGEKLGHSYSKIIHEKMGLNYSLREVQREDIPLFLEEEYVGFNITTPYKKEIIPYLHFVDDVAKEIQSVNTVVKKDGKMYGYTTDLFGMEVAFTHNNVQIAGKNVMILGTGGTKNVAYALAKKHNAKQILVVGRKGEINYSNCYDYKDTQIIINATPIGTYPNEDGKIIDLERFEKLEFVFDCNYNPLSTQLVLKAKSLGKKAAGGLMMLVAQALKSEEIWTEKEYCQEDCIRIYKEIVKEKRNIVLMGMAGCGKSTVANLLSQKLNMPFIDTDEEVVNISGKTPKELIESFGEPYFRDIEEQAVQKAALNRGYIIALGGGAILRELNRDRLKRNGLVIYLNRDVEKLVDDDRPISKKVGIKELFESRKAMYESFCDYKVDNNGKVEDTVKKIVELI
ncbi:MAG: dephospho-CoA kinase [Clostridia bacterium]|nr:dephospho-CoA kinase [Clostridia bacterium]